MRCTTCQTLLADDGDFCIDCGSPRPNLALGQTTKLATATNATTHTPRKRPWQRNIPAACAVLAILGFFVFGAPPSDETLLQQFRQHSELKQLVAMVEHDQEPFMMHNNGDRFMGEGQTSVLSPARLASYQTLLKQSGASTMFGGNDQGIVTFYYRQLISLPGLPVKSLVYAPTAPAPLTTGQTDFYHFQPHQYQYVCRSIEPRWYVCKDNED